MASEIPSTSDYVRADEPVPARNPRMKRGLILALSFAAIAVGVVCVVVLIAAPSSSDSAQDVSRARVASEDWPIPFTHEPNCPVMQFCRDSYVTKDASSKQQLLMRKVAEDKNSGPEASISDQITILDPRGLVDPETNPFAYAIQSLIAGFGSCILSAISQGLDVRTTFGQGLDWQNLKPAFLTGDQLEMGRVRTIHSVGVTGAVRFDTTGAAPHPYTGMLKDGFDGIIRMSSAAGVKRGSMKKRYIFFGPEEVKSPFIVGPGFGLKALVSGKPSADLVAMWHLDGQAGEWNFFAHEFSTVVPGSEATPLKLVGKKFEDASLCPSHVSPLGFAEHKADGTAVSTPIAPYALVFVPNRDLKARFDRLVTDGLGPTDVHACPDESACPDVFDSIVRNVPVGQELYTVYAIANPTVKGWHGEPGRYEYFDPSADAGIKMVGKLYLQSVLGSGELSTGLTRSKFGDTGIFFKHRLFEDGALNAFCGPQKENWVKEMRTSHPVLSRNQPTCSIGGNDNDGTDTGVRKDLFCRLLFRSKAEFPDCFNSLVSAWNAGSFFPFPRPFAKISSSSAWVDFCGRDGRPIDSAAREMVDQSFSA